MIDHTIIALIAIIAIIYSFHDSLSVFFVRLHDLDFLGGIHS
jgi:hypothetical protein